MHRNRVGESSRGAGPWPASHQADITGQEALGLSTVQHLQPFTGAICDGLYPPPLGPSFPPVPFIPLPLQMDLLTPS